MIFFRRPGGTPFYVGDGRRCSSRRLPSPIPLDLQFLGPLDRFKATGAWDLEEDGLPDFLVINDSFIYDLTGDELLVDVDVLVGGEPSK